LREVAAKLSHLKDDLWTRTTLYVLKKQVIFHEEGTGRLTDVKGQYVLTVPLKLVISNMAEESRRLRVREPHQIGQVVRNRFVAHNAWVVAGTRIPTAAIKRYRDAGYSYDQIISEYPDLTHQDIKAALEHEDRKASVA